MYAWENHYMQPDHAPRVSLRVGPFGNTVVRFNLIGTKLGTTPR